MTSQVTEIIVYRNPSEQALWEMLRDPGTQEYLFPVLSGVVAFLVLVWVFAYLNDTGVGRRLTATIGKRLGVSYFQVRSFCTYIALAIGIILTYRMWP